MISIIDYGLGNLGSISNMLKVIGEKSVISSDIGIINASDGIILPGVGAFDAGMSKLKETGLDQIIIDEALSGKPVLGICLGMQLLGRKSEEGNLQGLSLIPFECKRFVFDDSRLKVPHMGWDIVNIKKDHSIIHNLNQKQRYYFVHSYYAECDDDNNVLMTCDYGHTFTAAVCNKNIIGVQFHPEKSHDFGLALLRNYVDLCRENKR